MNPKSLNQIRKEVQQTADKTRRYLHHRLRIQALKGLVGFLLYLYLWHSHTMVKWTLLVVLPIGLFYLLKVIQTKHRLEEKLTNVMEEIDRLES